MSFYIKKCLHVLVAFGIYFFPIYSLASTYQVIKLASGLGIPWGMSFLSNNELIFTERGGKVGVLRLNSGDYHYLTTVPGIYISGQGGLLDVAKPSNESNDWIYFTYSKLINGNGATTLSRAHIKEGELQDWQDLLVTDSVTDTDRHFGSRIAFNDNYVFFSVGDRGHRPNAQDLGSHAGSIIRLNMDGSVPDDNPFVSDPGALDEIWSYGHRNPQGLVWDKEYERLWSIEHGPRGGDEINIIKKGKNYGWPTISYGKEYWLPIAVGEDTAKEGMEQPIKYYVPSIAPGSLIIYTGESFPQWKGSLLSGALKLQHINIVKIDSSGNALSEKRVLSYLNERIRALTQSNEGWIYFSTDSGNIYVIKPE